MRAASRSEPVGESQEVLFVGGWNRNEKSELGARCRHPEVFMTLSIRDGWWFIEPRIADRRVVRLIQKWLQADVREVGKRVQSEIGTVQGSG